MKGSIVALITPFLNKKVDFHKLEELLDFHLVNETDGLLLLGTTGESSTLSLSECREIVVFCNEYINNRLELMVGICTNDTSKAINDCKYYESIGIENFLVITPYYNKTNEDGIYRHFEKIAESISSNIIIYNIPSRTNINLTYDMIKRLSIIENIVGIKDANENFKETIKLFDISNFDVYCGNDEYMIPFMMFGAKGIINVSGNIIPKEINDIYNLCLSKDYSTAMGIFNIYKSFIVNLFLETNPIGVKTAMEILSMSNAEMRAPLYKMSDNNVNKLRMEILEIGKYFNS